MKVSKLILPVFLLLWAISFFVFGFMRISSGINSIEDYYIKHYASMGVSYLIWGIVFGVISIILIIILFNEKEEKEEGKEDPILISYVKEKTKIKGNPKTKKELYELAKTISKKIDVTNAIKEYYKSGKKQAEGMALLYSVLIASKVGLKKTPKSPAHLFKLAEKEGKLKEVAKEFDKFRPINKQI